MEKKTNKTTDYKLVGKNESKQVRVDPDDNNVGQLDEERAAKIEACVDKSFHSGCSWSYKGVTYSGRCVYNQLSLTPQLYCSDIFKND